MVEGPDGCGIGDSSMLPRVDVRCRKSFTSDDFVQKLSRSLVVFIPLTGRRFCTCNLLVNCGIQQKNMFLLRHFAVVVHIIFSL